MIDASGTWQNPNPIGAHGLPAMGEKFNQHIAYGIPDILGKDSSTYANQRSLVVGSGHSALNALLDLGKLAETYPETRIFWAMRGTNLKLVYGGGTDDALPARGALGSRMQQLVASGRVQIISPFFIERIDESETGLTVWGEGEQGWQSVEVERRVFDVYPWLRRRRTSENENQYNCHKHNISPSHGFTSQRKKPPGKNRSSLKASLSKPLGWHSFMAISRRLRQCGKLTEKPICQKSRRG